MNDPRFSSIGDILKTPPRPGPTTLAPAAPTEQAAQPPKARPARNPSEPATTDSRRSSGADVPPRRVVFRLPEALHNALAARVRHEQSSKSNVVLDALEAALGEQVLTQLVATAQEEETVGSIFQRTRTQRQAHPMVLVEIRVKHYDLMQIDELARSHGARNRTALLTAALRHYLI